MDSQKSWLQEATKKVVSQIVQSTCQFFEKIDNQFYCVGSGVLIKYKGVFFIVTAAHVLNKKGVLIFLSDKYFPCNEENNKIVSTSGKIGDTIDIGIIKLSEDAADVFNIEYDFISSKQLMLNHRANLENRFLVGGFPGDRTEIKSESDLIKSRFMNLMTEEVIIENNYYGYNSKNILVEYQIKELFELGGREKKDGPLPFGVSGGGLWYLFPNKIEEVIKSYLSNAKLEYYLAGIMIEYRKDDHILVATKMDEILNIIDTEVWK